MVGHSLPVHAHARQVAVTAFDPHGGTRLALLARAGELLSSPGAGEHTLERLAALLVPSLAGWCAIDVLREDGDIARVAAVPSAASRWPIDSALSGGA